MRDGPGIAGVAALIGDPARANMLTALSDGRALTVSELAEAAGVALSTASEHAARLADAGLVVARKQGRHRYLAIADADVAAALESLMALAARAGPRPVRTGPRDAELRAARVCYDHLAGERAVAMLTALVARGVLTDAAEPVLTEAGRAWLPERGIAVAPLERGRRPACRACLDWSERKSHLGGTLGAAILRHALAEGWAQRGPGRVIRFTPRGAAAFDAAFLRP